jgi:hypothetical protein
MEEQLKAFFSSLETKPLPVCSFLVNRHHLRAVGRVIFSVISSNTFSKFSNPFFLDSAAKALCNLILLEMVLMMEF